MSVAAQSVQMSTEQAPNYRNSHQSRTLCGLTTALCNQTGPDSGLVRSMYTSLCIASHLHRCKLRATSVCEESGEAGVANICRLESKHPVVGPSSGPNTA